jgi:DNA-binding response OmpR family regulator
LDQSPKRVLVVDDDADILQLMVNILEDDSFQVQTCIDGKQALKLLEQEAFDLILADIKMPRLTGTDLLFRIRQMGLGTKVIMITAYASLDTAVQALQGQAVDYLIKPFTLKEFRERVYRALQLPVPASRPSKPLEYKGMILHEDTHKVLIDGREVPLTRQEFNVLLYLSRHRGEPVSAEELLRHVWRHEGLEKRSLTAVKSCIFRLRKKIEKDSRHPEYIRNSWGVGYQFGE